MRKLTNRPALLAGASVLIIAAAGAAHAQTAVDEVIVTGSRSAPRTAMESPVPVDAYGADDIEAVSFADTQDVLKTLVPSYTLARQPISDGASFIRPASLRGLSSDKTLLLVNSKRRHRGALVVTGGSGSQPQDAAQIPASALKTVEVLRDGAGAQYGSDAIAGVINFILKDNDEGGMLSVQAGQYYEGDGDEIVVAGNKGFKLGEDGFLSASFEYITMQPTSRGKQICNVGVANQAAGFCVASLTTSNPDPRIAAYAAMTNYQTLIQNPIQTWGVPDTEAFRTFFNAGYDLGQTQLYAFANYSRSSSRTDFNYRPPIDMNTLTTNLDNPIRNPDGSLFTFNQLFPLGYTPKFFGNVTDYSLVGGAKGDWGGLGYDFSARYGNDKIAYKMTNTRNGSLGRATPTTFHMGDLIADEAAANADFTYEWAVAGMANPIGLAFGAEYRKESYEIVTGEVASYVVGPYALPDPFDFCTGGNVFAPTNTLRPTAPQNMGINCASASDPVYQVMAAGSDGFPGYPPLYSGTLSRDSYAIYGDASTDVTDQLFLQAAIRAESFSDFGDTLDGKLAGRFEFNDMVAVRGSIGTGFRAPTTGQQFTTVASTVVNNGVPVNQGLFPATNAVSVYLGAKPLEPEKSKNLSVGVTSTPLPGLNITADFYVIKVDGLFNAVPAITVTPAIQAAMVAAGVPGAASIGQVTFFQNALDVTISGLDVVGTYRANWDNGQTTDFSASFNYNQPIIDSVDPFIDVTGTPRVYFDSENIRDFKKATPAWRSVLTANHRIGPFSAMVRANIWGGFSEQFSVAVPVIQEFPAETLVDLEFNYEFSETYKLTVGGRNIFDNYPDPDKIGESTTNGRIYRSDALVDWQGGYYFAKVTATF